jgi:hypothetical protein
VSLESLMAFAEEAEEWMLKTIVGRTADTTDRTLAAAACFQQVHEHAAAVRILLKLPNGRQLPGSSMALVRPAHETFVRGIWFLRCASQSQLDDYVQHDKVKPRMQQLIEAIERRPEYNVGALSFVHAATWEAMCSFTHGGQRSIVRRLTGGKIAPDYPEWLLSTGLRIVCMDALLAGLELSFLLQLPEHRSKLHDFARRLNEIPINAP